MSQTPVQTDAPGATATRSASNPGRSSARWACRLFGGILCATSFVLLAQPAHAQDSSGTVSWSCDSDGNCWPNAGGSAGYGIDPGIGGPKPDRCVIYPDLC